MNSYNIITVTRNKGLRAVRGATFKVSHLYDSRHFVKCKREGLGDGTQIDAALLNSSEHARVSHQDHPARDKSGAYTEWFVGLQNVGLARDCERKFVLVKPIPSDLPHVPGLSGVCDPVLIWFPEPELQAINTGITQKEAHWIMPGLVRLLTMSSLWMEWRNPNDRMRPPVSIKVECSQGECFLEEGYTKTDSGLTAYKPF
ncbi:MAG: hypothetical protein P4L53_22860 [Candidatus Obscuribacterales bacterium]|nr:hypothetical protein [Candidatus Obscuribacterales bacterium]